MTPAGCSRNVSRITRLATCNSVNNVASGGRGGPPIGPNTSSASRRRSAQASGASEVHHNIHDSDAAVVS